MPADFKLFFLGWNASGWAADTTETATISHPRGDLKKFSHSSSGLRRARYSAGGGGGASSGGGGSGVTHYKVRWTDGGTDTGSSGAPPIDVASRQMLGVLTGGEAATCHNQDLFGSLRAAWQWGLWRVLSPAGPEAVMGMPGSALRPSNTSSLIVTPGALNLEESSSMGQQLLVRLSAPPTNGETLTVAVSVRQPDGPAPGQQQQQQQRLSSRPEAEAGAVALAADGSSPAAAAVARITISLQSLRFDGGNWDQEQQLVVNPGDDSQAALPAAFDILLELSGSSAGAQRELSGSSAGAQRELSGSSAGAQRELSGSGSGSEDGHYGSASSVWQQLVVPGRRMDNDVHTGDTPQQPFLIQANEQLDYAHDGLLQLAHAAPAGAGAGADVAAGTQVAPLAAAAAQLGQPLGGLAAATGRAGGSISYFNLTTSLTVNISVSACSVEAASQVVVFANDVAAWLSTGPCSGGSDSSLSGPAANGCLAISGADGECSGFRGLLLTGLGNSAPYTLAVLPLPSPSASNGGVAAAGSKAANAVAAAAGGSSTGGTDASSLGGTEGISPGGAGGDTAHYELQVTSTPQAPTFVTVASD